MIATFDKIAAIVLLSGLFYGLTSSLPFANLNSQLDVSTYQQLSDKIRTIIATFEQMLEDSFSQIQGSLDIVVEKCKKSEKNDIANNIQSNTNLTFNCIRRRINITQMICDVLTNRNKNVNLGFVQLCNIIPHADECLNPMLNDIRNCIDKDDELVMDHGLRLTFVQMTFWCENNQKNLKNFYSVAGFQCLSMTLANKNVIDCLKPMTERQIHIISKKGALFYDQECSDAHSYRTCVGDSMESVCSSAKTILNNYFDVNQKAACNELFTKSQP